MIRHGQYFSINLGAKLFCRVKSSGNSDTKLFGRIRRIAWSQVKLGPVESVFTTSNVIKVIRDGEVLHEHPVTIPDGLLQVNSKVGEVLSSLQSVFTINMNVLRTGFWFSRNCN